MSSIFPRPQCVNHDIIHMFVSSAASPLVTVLVTLLTLTFWLFTSLTACGHSGFGSRHTGKGLKTSVSGEYSVLYEKQQYSQEVNFAKLSAVKYIDMANQWKKLHTHEYTGTHTKKSGWFHSLQTVPRTTFRETKFPTVMACVVH